MYKDCGGKQRNLMVPLEVSNPLLSKTETQLNAVSTVAPSDRLQLLSVYKARATEACKFLVAHFWSPANVLAQTLVLLMIQKEFHL